MPGTRTNQDWLLDLTSSGPAQEAAILDLRDLLLRAVLFFYSRNTGDFGRLSHAEILQSAEDCAQDALIALLSRLQDFRGESKFSTWAYKFAINTALMAARRERWKGVSLDELSEPESANFESLARIDSSPQGPEHTVVKTEVMDVIRAVVESDLTDKQRQVLTLMVFNEVPMDEVVRHLGSNRNSVYKLLHDARIKLKAGLQARGFEVGETLNIFGG